MPLILPLWQIEIQNEFDNRQQLPNVINLTKKQQNIFVISIKFEPKNRLYFITCCHRDIKEHFIRSIKKGQKLCL